MKFFRYILIFMIFFVVFLLLNKLVTLKYQSDLIEGSLTREYYQSKKEHDVIILGDCEVYDNISPMEIYRNTKIKSYVRGNSQQMIWQSYYLLKETLKYEKPEIVVLSVGALRNGVSMKNEAYNRLLADYMKWSKEKINLINSSKTSEESILSYIFPILRYHQRITKLTKEDFKYLFKKKNISYNGYLMNKKVKPLDNLPTKRPLLKDDFDDEVIKYLDLIVELCKDENIELVLIKAPSLYPYWYDEHETFVSNYAKENDLKYYNFLDLKDEIGIDYNLDTPDGGQHLNLSGATKLSRYLAIKLKEDFNLNKENDKYYDELLSKYDKNI